MNQAEQEREASARQSWTQMVNDLRSEFPEHMKLLTDEGCSFSFDDVTGSFHLHYDNGAYVNVYPPYSLGWSVGGTLAATGKSHFNYNLDSFPAFATAVCNMKNHCKKKLQP